MTGSENPLYGLCEDLTRKILEPSRVARGLTRGGNAVASGSR